MAFRDLLKVQRVVILSENEFFDFIYWVLVTNYAISNEWALCEDSPQLNALIYNILILEWKHCFIDLCEQALVLQRSFNSLPFTIAIEEWSNIKAQGYALLIQFQIMFHTTQHAYQSTVSKHDSSRTVDVFDFQNI